MHPDRTGGSRAVISGYSAAWGLVDLHNEQDMSRKRAMIRVSSATTAAQYLAGTAYLPKSANQKNKQNPYRVVLKCLKSSPNMV